MTLLSPDAGPVIVKVRLRTARRIRAFVNAAFLAGCDRLHPLYAGVGVEWSISLPTELGSPGTWLPGDVFWSNELDKVDMSLARDLATIYGRPGRAFSHGTLIEVGRLLDVQAQSPTQPLATGRVAATRLARSIAKLDFSHLRSITDSIS
jgi:hypothetical protein